MGPAAPACSEPPYLGRPDLSEGKTEPVVLAEETLSTDRKNTASRGGRLLSAASGGCSLRLSLGAQGGQVPGGRRDVGFVVFALSQTVVRTSWRTSTRTAGRGDRVGRQAGRSRAMEPDGCADETSRRSASSRPWALTSACLSSHTAPSWSLGLGQVKASASMPSCGNGGRHTHDRPGAQEGPSTREALRACEPLGDCSLGSERKDSALWVQSYQETGFRPI